MKCIFKKGDEPGSAYLFLINCNNIVKDRRLYCPACGVVTLIANYSYIRPVARVLDELYSQLNPLSGEAV
jgi:hypothetical protein